MDNAIINADYSQLIPCIGYIYQIFHVKNWQTNW